MRKTIIATLGVFMLTALPGCVAYDAPPGHVYVNYDDDDYYHNKHYRGHKPYRSHYRGSHCPPGHHKKGWC